ncbi:MAG: hypothetical protein MR278_01665 [Bacteroidales bacterium]|nr:hypothetical protein [Bacteroidales bacterium]
MESLLDFLSRFLGIFLGMLLYDFVERKINSIKGTPEDNDKESSHDKNDEV